ncbi:MAG: hypothetical protein SVY10_15945 [Thermodesulfobacteriota bacterium]|nr:hypothetical protein [Thermodesulfobacteriota bacterium]
MKHQGLLKLILRLITVALGLVLLMAGLSKATDMSLFIQQIKDYNILSGYLFLTLAAWGLIAAEFVLGTALLVLYRPRLTLSMTSLLLLTFLGATLWAWINGATQECGCFGAWVKRTPLEAVFEDIILLVFTFLAWAGYGRRRVRPSRAKAWAVVGSCLIGLMLPMVFGFSPSRINLPQSQAIRLELGDLQVEGLEHLGVIDFNQGAYLIILMDTDCSHCKDSVPLLNELAETSSLPPVIALTINDEQKRMTFIEDFQPVFPLGQIDENSYWRLLAAGDIPRMILVQDGWVKQVWDKVIPDINVVEESLIYGN